LVYNARLGSGENQDRDDTRRPLWLMCLDSNVHAMDYYGINMKQVFDDSIDYREEWRKCRISIKGAPENQSGTGDRGFGIPACI